MTKEIRTRNSPQNATDQRHEHHGFVVEEMESLLHVTDADIADYTESVVPDSERRSNFRMLAQFMSMQAVFGTVLVAMAQGSRACHFGS